MKKPYINPKLPEEAQEILLHVKDLVFKTEKTGHTEFTHFLSENERIFCEEFMAQFSRDVNFVFRGGWDGAQRTVLCVYDIYSEQPQESDFPYSCVTFEFRKSSGLTHRDFLGSLMACGIKRDVIGDIYVSDDMAQIFVLDNFVETVSEISKVGNTGVTFLQDKEFIPIPQKFSDINSTVSSLRLDSVIKAMLNLSREKAAELIRSGRVVRNGIPENSVSEKCVEGDLFSVKGYGKFRLAEAGEVTKKGRIRIKIKKYL